MEHEPSVLDYVKSKLMPWKSRRIDIPQQPDEGLLDEAKEWRTDAPPLKVPWRVFLSLGLALMAQLSLEPREQRTWLLGSALYLAAAAVALWSNWAGELTLAEHLPPAYKPEEEKPVLGRAMMIVAAGGLSLVALFLFGNKADGIYRFNTGNLVFWFAALFVMIAALWPGNIRSMDWRKIWNRVQSGTWTIRISWWSLLFLAVFAAGMFFRFYQLNSVPPEMVSDHAEKLLDVQDVLNGQYNTYFPRNTGREFFQFYWTALVVLLFGQGVSYLSLKLGTVILGVLTLPFIYLIGKELGSKRVGLLAMGFAGIAYWPNLISRIALRFTLYPFFYAPTLYFFLRGMRTMRRKDFILAGLFLGLGLHGYSPFRIVPILLVIGLVLFLLHGVSKGVKKQAIYGLIVIALISLVVFLPLLRYGLDNPEMVGYRALTRLGNMEQNIQGQPLQIFFKNLWRALTMFAWDDGEVWVISITHRPVLDVVSGALYHLGGLLLWARYLRRRQWVDLFMLISVVVLMLPSILSLAFPNENPCLNRTAAAIIPAFLLVGYALDGIMSAVERLGRHGPTWAWLAALMLFTFSATQNYDLVFHQYQKVYQLSSWNTSEMGRIARGFSESVGSVDTTYLVGYPHWADSRLVGIASGYPTKDYAIWPDQFEATQQDPRAKLFLLNPQDQADAQKLQEIYPGGILYNYDVPIEGKDFLLFFVPPSPGVNP